jgi:hypothetical protein
VRTTLSSTVKVGFTVPFENSLNVIVYVMKTSLS